ncbi:MAG: DUF3050 domain-containing protein [Fuerstiella sp.]|nr:DUF3050 domain-containing protein [Fuerstiella sp.]
MSGYHQLESRLVDLRRDLTNHEVYDRLSTIESLHVLMEQHVFAVWEFMLLLKALQRKLTCVDVPWRATAQSAACRLENEIVLAEESDLGPDGQPASHFELYLAAMKQVGADTRTINHFLHNLEANGGVQCALLSTAMPSATRNFVATTFEIIDSEDICQIASAFTFGREELLPSVFQQNVCWLNASTDGVLSGFEYYLDRDVELDGDEHGAKARHLMESLCGDDSQKWKAAEHAAVRSLEARKLMWDSIADEMDAVSPQPCLVGLS